MSKERTFQMNGETYYFVPYKTEEELNAMRASCGMGPMSKTPYGYCECGCGQKTKLHNKADATKGHVPGVPRRFIAGHQNRGSLNPQYKGDWRKSVERPSGLCECGCGQQTEIATRDRPYLGIIAGHPLRFIRGHARKGQGTPAYPTVYMPEHPRANSGGRVLEHIITAEAALGKVLPEGAQVHHYTKTQLVICQDQAYHSLLHQRQRAYEACGHASWIKCDYCGEYDDPENMYCPPSKNGRGRHRKCIAEYMKEWELTGRRGIRSVDDIDWMEGDSE